MRTRNRNYGKNSLLRREQESPKESATRHSNFLDARVAENQQECHPIIIVAKPLKHQRIAKNLQNNDNLKRILTESLKNQLDTILDQSVYKWHDTNLEASSRNQNRIRLQIVIQSTVDCDKGDGSKRGNIWIRNEASCQSSNSTTAENRKESSRESWRIRKAS